MPKDLNAWSEELETSLERNLAIDEKEYLDKLSHILEKLEWRDELYAKDLFEIATKLGAKDAPSFTFANWTTKPSSEYELWPYVADQLLQREISLPEFIANDPRISGIIQQRLLLQRKKETRRWKNRLANLSQSNPLPPSAKIETRLKLQGRVFRWESRFSGETEWEALPAKEISQRLAKEFDFLDQFAPNSMALCAFFQEYYKLTQRVRLDLEKPEDCSFLNKLLSNSETKKQIVSTNDQPLQISETKIIWKAQNTLPDPDDQYAFSLQFEDGRPIPFNTTYLAGSQNLYLAEEVIHQGPQLLENNASPSSNFKIPAQAIESPEGLLFLKKQNLPIPERLDGKIIAIPLKAQIYCQLSQEKGSSKTIEIRPYASSPDNRFWFTLNEEAWEATENFETQEENPPTEEGTLFEFPDATAILESMSNFKLELEDTALWIREINSGFAQEFIRWIQDLPDEVQLIPDEELDTLIDQHPAGRYALNIEASDQPDWFDIKLDIEKTDNSLTTKDVELLIDAKGEYVYLEGKGWRKFEFELDKQQEAIVDELGLNFAGSKSEKHSVHALQLADAKLAGTEYEKLGKQIAKRAKTIKSSKPASLPKGMRTELRPYQEEGFKFLAHLSSNGFGGILADDMGLGKTLQTLTWLTWLKHRVPRDETFQCLVVCPKSVMHVWKKEVENHSGILKIATYQAGEISSASWPHLGIDILVANYSQLRINGSFFSSIDWDACILDEGQYIKNPQSQTARAAFSLKAKHKLVLTGTPIENKTLDLWSLFAFSLPGLLGSQTAFKRQYKEVTNVGPNKLSQRVKHFMLRRSKTQVATDLPDRIEETLSCQLEDKQLELYNAELKEAQGFIKKLDTADNANQARFNILASLLRLRQICCHPGLINPSYRDYGSAKLEALKEHVASLMEEGHKVLVFSQFVEMLNIIKQELDEMGCNNRMLTGKTQNREALVDEFQNDPSITVFLLSLKAAGSGLNLTSASYVILYDPWWNPAVEAQAIDRTHRIGQKDTVNAYRLIAKDSVEEKIQSLQLKKEELARQVVREESLNTILDIDSLKYVLSS
ncbi:DEAD/DEAH box helicase [Puniceicoccaceae bacterium K14]|nr:DEAD/DEAH box helicase [Puniceicoccaceae bacterium K14]